ncbi:hypothetical protein ACLE20_06915 [Rhizobium sp. YIM 134829]|uniref:hypothetical protein n=1 Tax=Rhizobium sp. YIM 134829 TaxID=3390453 RepID=UPI003979CC99
MTTYTFKIQDYKPETMPFGRLLEYYSEIKKLLGYSENIHLVSISEGSHATALAIDRNHETAIERRLAELKANSAPREAMRALQAINEMLSEDRTSGNFSDSNGRNVLIFPGRKPAEADAVQIRDAATFVGELYHIAGTRDDVKVRIATEAHGVVFCTTTRSLARQLRDYLFEFVKVSGRGMWTRGEDGSWEISDFTITDLTPVKKETLRQSVDRIRAVGVDWPEETLGELDKLEGRPLQLR